MEPVENLSPKTAQADWKTSRESFTKNRSGRLENMVDRQGDRGLE